MMIKAISFLSTVWKLPCTQSFRCS